MPPESSPDLKSDTFSSVLPGVEDVLECVYNLAEGGDTSIDEVVTRVSPRRCPLLTRRRLGLPFAPDLWGRTPGSPFAGVLAAV